MVGARDAHFIPNSGIFFRPTLYLYVEIQAIVGIHRFNKFGEEMPTTKKTITEVIRQESGNLCTGLRSISDHIGQSYASSELGVKVDAFFLKVISGFHSTD